MEDLIRRIRDDVRDLRVSQSKAFDAANTRLASLEKLVKYGLTVVGILTVVGWFL